MKIQNLINDWLQNNSSLLEWFGIYIPIFVLLIAGVYLIFLVGEIYKSKTGPIFKIIGVYSIRLALHILILNIIFYKISEFHQVRNELLILLIGIYIIFDPLSIIILFIKNIKLLIKIQKNGEYKVVDKINSNIDTKCVHEKYDIINTINTADEIPLTEDGTIPSKNEYFQ